MASIFAVQTVVPCLTRREGAVEVSCSSTQWLLDLHGRVLAPSSARNAKARPVHNVIEGGDVATGATRPPPGFHRFLRVQTFNNATFFSCA